MKRILFITLEYPPQRGGVASYYHGLVEELKRQGYEVEVISEGLLSKWIWPKWMKTYFIVRRALHNVQYDLLFVGQVLPLGTVAYLLRKRIPYAVFTHGMDVLMAQRSRRKRWLVKKVLMHAKIVVANSEFTAQTVRTNFDDRQNSFGQNVAVVYPCPNIVEEVKREEVEALRRRLGLTGKKVLLTLGRVVERKGHDLVLRAMPEILKHVPEAIYVIAGDGPDLERLQRMVSDNGSSVRFVGAVSNEERPRYHALCDLFVMPSRQIGPDVEGFGIVFLEAAMFGKPSIGGRSGGQGEAILDGKTGALVDPNDPVAFARVAVQLLHDDGLRYELGQNAKARVMYEFRWERQIATLLKTLSS